MSFLTKVGSLTSPTSTGNQAITGVGFQPKAIIFWGFYNPTADGSIANVTPFYGIVSDTTHRGAVNFASTDNVSPLSQTVRGHANDKVIYATGTAATIRLAADLVSFDADGFTINWSTVQATGYIVNYMCLGGADLTNAIVLQNTTKTTTGSQGYTGAGFKPDALITISAGHGTAPDNTQQNIPHPFMSFATATAQKALSLSYEDDGASHALPQTQQKTDVLSLINGVGTQTLDATLTSLDTDGFTLNYGAADATARYFWTLCLKGGQYKVGVDTQNTSASTKATTGVGFVPTGLLLMSQGQAASTSIQNAGRQSFGGASATNARGAIALDNQYNATTTSASENLDRANIIKVITAGHGTPTVVSAADLSSFDSDGFTLNWGTADATAREFIYMAFGSTAITGPSALGNPFHPGRGVVNRARFRPSQQQGIILGNSYTQVLTDTLTLTSTIIRNPKKVLSESLTLTSSVAKKWIHTLSDSITLTSSVLKKPIKVLSDSVTLTSTLIKNPKKVLSESLTLTSSVAKKWIHTLSDSITLTSSVTKIKTQFRTLTDVVTLTSSILKNPKKVLSDTATLTSSVTAVKFYARTFTDAITLVSTIAKKATKVFLETVSLTSAITRRTTKVFSAVLTLSENFTATRIKVKSVTDAITLTVVFSTKIITVRVLTDTLVFFEIVWIKFTRGAVTWVMQAATSAIYSIVTAAAATWSKFNPTTTAHTKENPTATTWKQRNQTNN
jgi:hypothetical protein